MGRQRRECLHSCKVVVSSHSDRTKMAEAVEAGCPEFLLKPIVPWIFTAKLKAVLEKPAQLVTTDGYGLDRRRRFLRVSNCQRRPPMLSSK